MSPTIRRAMERLTDLESSEGENGPFHADGCGVWWDTGTMLWFETDPQFEACPVSGAVELLEKARRAGPVAGVERHEAIRVTRWNPVVNAGGNTFDAERVIAALESLEGPDVEVATVDICDPHGTPATALVLRAGGRGAVVMPFAHPVADLLALPRALGVA